MSNLSLSQMVVIIRDSQPTNKIFMAKEFFISSMGIYILEIGRIVVLKEKESIYIEIRRDTREVLKTQ
jgi:hypothetical protein